MPDVVTVQVLHDSSKKYTAKFTNVSDSTGETAVQKVDVSALNNAITTISFDGTGTVPFLIGETVTSDNGDPGSATIVGMTAGSIDVIDISGTFDDNDVLTGGVSGAVHDQAGAVALATYRLNISKVKWNIDGMKVKISWDATVDVDALVLSGNGSWNLSEWPGAINNNAGGGITGDIMFTTIGAAANDTYTILLECHKVSGYGTKQAVRI